MSKSPDAFRTISEVADWLGLQAHVLRFWESKFSQVKPIKRAGGRRYYRPNDMLLLGGLKKLLHEDGLTIKGAQKMLRENGVAHVAELSPPLDDLTTAVIEGTEDPQDDGEEVNTTSAVSADIVAATDDETPGDAPGEVQPEEVARPAEVLEAEPVEEQEEFADSEPSEDQPTLAESAESPIVASDAEDEPFEATQTDAIESEPELNLSEPIEEDGRENEALAEHNDEQSPMPSFRARPRSAATQQPVETSTDLGATEAAEETAAKPPSENEADVEAPGAVIEEPAEEIATATLKPRMIDVAPVPAASQISVEPAALTILTRMKHITPEHAREIKPLVARLTRLRASMANPRKETRKD